jgi:hypothetical protein
MPSDTTQQRIFRDTKRKLAELSGFEGRTSPQQLKVIIDREYEAQRLKLEAQPPKLIKTEEK